MAATWPAAGIEGACRRRGHRTIGRMWWDLRRMGRSPPAGRRPERGLHTRSDI